MKSSTTYYMYLATISIIVEVHMYTVQAYISVCSFFQSSLFLQNCVALYNSEHNFTVFIAYTHNSQKHQQEHRTIKSATFIGETLSVVDVQSQLHTYILDHIRTHVHVS